MPIEQNVQHIDDLNPQNPPATDPLGQVYNHLNLIKTAVKQTFPNVTDAVTATHTVLNGLDGRVTAVEGRDLPAIKDNNGTPALVSGITAAEVKELLGLHSNNSPLFNVIKPNKIDFQNSLWKIETSGNDLLFKYNGATKFKMTSTGAFSAVDDIIAEATI